MAHCVIIIDNIMSMLSPHNIDATAVLFAGFGRGTGPIHIDDVNCQGFEDALINCTYDSNTADCQHFEDAGVRCQRM